MSDAFKNIPGINFTDTDNFLLIAGPCVVENEDVIFETAGHLKMLSEKYEIPFIFKSSYRKANRSKAGSFTGIGDENALKLLAGVREKLGLPVITDIHNPEEAAFAAEFVDVLQIPAFLCRQTDILVAAAKTGKWINIKKGQFLSGSAMRFAVEKVMETGNKNIMLTDRGNMFGYQDMIVDFRNIPEMQKIGFPVIMDITHSLQQPNQEAGVTGGRPEMIETIGKAAISTGADGIFIETHPEPSEAKSDGANMLKLSGMDDLLRKLTLLRKNSYFFPITKYKKEMKKVLFAITGLLLVTTISAQSLQEIVDRYSKANMFDKLGKLSTMKITAKMSMPSMGVELPMQLWMKNPDKIRQVTSFNGQDIISTFDGTKGYTLNPMTGSSTPVEMSAEEVKQAKTNMVFKNTLQESFKAGKLTLMGEENVKDRPAFKIKADIEGIPAVIYIDKETYLVTKQSITANQGGMSMTVDTYPTDYREVNGILLPMKTSTSLQGMDADIIYEKVEVNIPMEDSIFTLK